MTKVSNTGYKKNSKDKNEKSLIIPSSRISMEDVAYPILGIDNLGNQAMMYPGEQDYIFPGDFVQEFPIKEKGGQMKKPNNEGFKSLPKKVQDLILENMHKQMGGENLARPIWTMQKGGNFTPEQWNKFNMEKGLMPSPGYTDDFVTKNKTYLEFYDPKEFMPVPDEIGIGIGWNKIGDPSYKYTNETNSPFIKYKPPVRKPESQQTTYLDANSGRKAVAFDTNSTTYRYDDGTIKVFDRQGMEIQPLQRKMGGSLSKFVSNYQKQFGGEQGNKDLQGQSMDEFLQNKNNDFVNYLADNASNVLYRNEYNNFMQDGGQPKFGLYAQDPGVPDYVTAMTNQFNLPTQPINPYQFGMTQNGVNPNQVSFDADMQNRLAELPNQNNNQMNFNNGNLADLGMMGAQTLNKVFNKAQTYKQEQLLKQQQAISNTVPTAYGSKGFYDVNQGAIKPNQMTPSYKKGGQYSMSRKEIDELLAKGYDIEFLD